jgi:hypothetical protein
MKLPEKLNLSDENDAILTVEGEIDLPIAIFNLPWALPLLTRRLFY